MEEIVDIDIEEREQVNDYEEREEIIKPREQKQTASKSSGESNEGTNEDHGYWKLVLLRNTRNAYLALTDKYLLPDFPITDENRNIIKTYRQYLRDFINVNKEAIENGLNIEIDPIPNV